MNIFSKKLLPGLLLAAVLLVLSFSAALAQGNAKIRFVHAIPGGTAVDVFINGSLAITGLEYGSASTYMSVPAGSHTVTVTPAGIATPLWEQSITVEADKAVTFIASSPATLKFDAFPDSLLDTGFGKSRLLLVHALAGGSPVDVQLAEPVDLAGQVQPAGTTMAPGVAYGSSAALDLPSQTYVVNIIAGGTPLLSNLPLPMTSNTSNIVVIYGTPEAPQTMIVSAPTTPAADTGMVRLVHGVVGAPAVDVFIDDTLIAPALSTDRPTEHIALPSGTHDVVLKAAGTEDELLASKVEVTAGAAMTVVAVQGDTGVELKAFPDPVSGVTASSAIINVVNTIPGSASIDVALPDGTPIATGVAFGATGQAAALIPAITTGLKFTLTIGDRSGTIDIPPQTFYGGVYYNLVALDGGAFSAPTLLTAATSISQGLASAPGAGSITIATGGNTAPTESAEVATAAPTTDGGSEVVAAPTEAAPQPTTQPDVLPPATAVEKVTTARVLLDPGANLQLREYPRSDARSLGLAPSGTIFIVKGREGAPVALVEGGPVPPEAEDFVDPATLLDPEDKDADLLPEETWLNVNYSTPDGGTINAWVNALYLDVRNEKDERIKLATLPMVGNNVPGQTQATAVTPPPIPEDQITAIVFNLNQGTNLNIRRTPETEGEVLARLPTGTTVEVVGFLEDDSWVYIRFRPSEGGEITGWVNALYVKYRLNSKDVKIDDIKTAIGQYTLLPLYEVIPAERRGAISGGASGVALATPDPLKDAYIADVKLDSDANLQLRRNPDANSESLNLIPSGTRLVVESRNGSGEWLKVTFEGESGWVSARFVVVTFNSKPVEIIDIPVDGALAPAAEATAEPTAATTG